MRKLPVFNITQKKGLPLLKVNPTFFLLLFLLITTISLSAQSTINIALIEDEPPNSKVEYDFNNTIKEEVLQLLQYQYTVNFNEYFGDNQQQNLAPQFDNAYAENDIVVGVGMAASTYAISLKTYPKPTIVSIVMDRKLQGLDKTIEGTSGISAFTYLESPFDIARDLDVLYQIYPFEHLVVFAQNGRIGEEAFTKQLFTNYLKNNNISVSIANYEADLKMELDLLDDKKMAVYALPYFGSEDPFLNEFFQTLTERKIPSAALFGDRYLERGALVGFQTKKNLQKIPRRIALNIMKIVEGQEAATLSVNMETFGKNLLLNMETARQIEIYPTFDLMAQATLVNLENIQTDNTLTLQQAIAEGLKNNLDVRVEAADVKISDTEIDIAKADLLPQVDVSTSLSVLDENTTLSYQGAQGRANWTLSGELSQVIFSEPLLANIAIQKMLKQSEEKELMEVQLETVINVTNAYINILFAKNNLNIQQENVARTRENYDISSAKEAIGYTGASDINRWEAELANASIELNNASAKLRQARFQLNQLRNRPINEVVEVENISIEEAALLITDNRMDAIDNYGKLAKFADYLVDYASRHLPELAQVDIGIAVQKRLQLSRERAMYLPSLGLSASANRILGKFNIPEVLTPKDNQTTWNAGLGLSYPIFQGNSRRKNIQQSKLSVLQLNDTRKNVENILELRIRSNIETVGVSYSRMNLSKTAAEASLKNFNIVQDAYSAGQSNITTVIDAQNNALQTELNATNAVYTFILDFLTLERSIGYFNFLADNAQRNAFFEDFDRYLTR